MSETVDVAQARIARPKPWRAPGPFRLASLAPFMLAILVQVAALGPRVGGPLFEEPTVVGIPIGVGVGALTLGWAALGALVIWTTGSRVAAALALAFLTLPSMFAMVLGPAALLVLQNLRELD